MIQYDSGRAINDFSDGNRWESSLESGAGRVSHKSRAVDDMDKSERKRTASERRSTICLQLKRNKESVVPVGV